MKPNPSPTFRERTLSEFEEAVLNSGRPWTAPEIAHWFLSFFDSEWARREALLRGRVANLKMYLTGNEAYGSGQGRYNQAIKDVLSLLPSKDDLSKERIGQDYPVWHDKNNPPTLRLWKKP